MQKTTINSQQFHCDFLWPFLDKLNRECTTEILDSLQHEPLKVEKNRGEIELEVAIWLHHITGKLLGPIKNCQVPNLVDS